MIHYKEDDYLSLSGIQHYEFCQRQWALIHIEQQWEDNLRTVEGEIMHEKAHNSYQSQRKGNVIISRGMPIVSHLLGMTGVCDIVEFYEMEKGVSIYGKKGTFGVYPIEYKRGEPKESNADILQVVAQAMCLEEMLCCTISEGAIFYGETRRRFSVIISEELRLEVMRKTKEMHDYYSRRYTPNVRKSKSCNSCSLKNICLPALNKLKTVHEYLNQTFKEEDIEKVT